ncbi:M56 family metallopeptidase [Aquimarina macrocephali]|uniref:M56 family metallopeptidase n=1 Tax=Aquimarina macrocephali TaxID=666563 RepID=UPI003F668EF6
MLYYLLQTVIFQVLFLVLYDVFHKKDTFFTWNRLYLIITPLLSLVLPFIKIEAFRNQTSQVYVTKLERVITISSENLVILGTTGADQNPTNWWLVLYCTGAGLSLLLLILKFYKLKILKTVSFKTGLNNKRIVTLPNSNQAFSFWNTIYLGDALSEIEKKQILIHEIVHVEQKHSLDQVWFELLKIAWWWNPMIYNYQSRITILHEYIADARVIATIDKRSYIEQLLNVTFQTQEITFVNQFFDQSLIKKRILMLQKSKSRTIAKFKYLLLIPVVVGILIYTSCGNESNSSIENDIGNSKNIKNGDFNCSNQNSKYNYKLDNYLRLTNRKKSDAIIEIKSTETLKTIRIVYVAKNTTQFIRNIPEGKYQIHITYVEEYAEKTIDEICTDYLKNEKTKEIDENTLDFYTYKTGKNLNVPSYNLSLDPDINSDKSSLDNNMKDKSLTVLTKNVVEPEITELTILTEDISGYKSHNIKTGYYLITNIFKHESYLKKGLKKLKEQGFIPKVFKNPKDNYFYAYLERYDTLDDAKKMHSSKMNGKYNSDLYILLINGK